MLSEVLIWFPGIIVQWLAMESIIICGLQLQIKNSAHCAPSEQGRACDDKEDDLLNAQ